MRKLNPREQVANDLELTILLLLQDGATTTAGMRDSLWSKKKTFFHFRRVAQALGAMKKRNRVVGYRESVVHPGGNRFYYCGWRHPKIRSWR